MKIKFVEKKLRVEPDIRNFAEKKVTKLDKFFRVPSEATVTFSVERGRCRAEVTLNNNGFYYRASELTNDMRASIDSACAAIERQIRKNKTRLEKRLRDGALEDIAVDFTPEVPEEAEPDAFEIVRTKRVSLKPMTAEEAILQMNMLDHEFFAFINSEDDSFSVVYRRKNGGYGLLSDEKEQ